MVEDETRFNGNNVSITLFRGLEALNLALARRPAVYTV